MRTLNAVTSPTANGVLSEHLKQRLFAVQRSFHYRALYLEAYRLLKPGESNRVNGREGAMDGQTDGWTGGRIDRQKDNHVYVYVSAYVSFFDRWFIKNRY